MDKKYECAAKAGLVGMVSIALIFFGAISFAAAQIVSETGVDASDLQSRNADTTANAALDFGIISPLQKAAQKEQELDTAFSQMESQDVSSSESEGENSDLNVVNQRLELCARQLHLQVLRPRGIRRDKRQVDLGFHCR